MELSPCPLSGLPKASGLKDRSEGADRKQRREKEKEEHKFRPKMATEEALEMAKSGLEWRSSAIFEQQDEVKLQYNFESRFGYKDQLSLVFTKSLRCLAVSLATGRLTNSPTLHLYTGPIYRVI